MLVPGCVTGGGVVFAGLVVGVVSCRVVMSFPGLAAMAWLIDRMETAPQDIRSTTVLSRALLEVIGEFRCYSPRASPRAHLLVCW